MELQAAIEGLEAVKRYGWSQAGEPIELVSDSLYVLGIASGVYHPKKNMQFAYRIRELYLELNVIGRWVKGHRGDKFNELADKLAKEGKLIYST